MERALSREAVERVVAEWNRAFTPAEPEPTEPEPEPEPIGPGVIPSAGHSPGELTREQMQALAAQAGGRETVHQKHARLNAMLRQQDNI